MHEFYIYDTYAFTYLCFYYQLLVIVCGIFRYFFSEFSPFLYILYGYSKQFLALSGISLMFIV